MVRYTVSSGLNNVGRVVELLVVDFREVEGVR